ncbi:tetratricopeptide repeat protein [Nostoc sp.]|uniref:tetratricopeptide repeat protein n=1 Tax=Nostoc sp. TaxID=1180 RepID=UPI002FF4A99E
MQTIRIQLRESTQETVELRYWLPQNNHYESRRLKLAEIADFLKQGERDYYKLLPNLPGIGQQLFFWLDGDGRWLSRGIANCRGEGLVIAIDTDKKLAHLPWEVLHDGEDFLVKRVNPVVLPLRWIEKEREGFSVEARQLRVLFMATDPEDVQPKLEFEQEEAKILADTRDFAVDLRVEESGCVSELGKVWSRYFNDFDVFHLTGHASIKDEAPYTPYFITETEIGERHETTAAELADVFRFRFPKLVFLSGCRTGQAPDKGAVPSMAEALIAQGARAVLSWGRPVEDRTATAAAAHLYGKLAAGYQLAEALASTYQQLFKQKVRDWHLLRLYVQGECPGALVEVFGLPPSVPEPAYEQFLDPDTQQVRVAKPSEFVGRRRTLQRCLKAIRTSLGVLIHGLGGVGKSTVTARLLERLVGYHRLVNFRQLDEDKLLKTLAEQCTLELGHEILNGKLPLMQRLTKFFKDGLNSTEQRFAFVLDDFEANLELQNGVYVLQPQVVDVLLALLKAIQNSQLPHKVIITCRYNFPLSELNHRLYREPLGALGGADLIKKYNRLDSFNGSWQFQPELPERAKKAADGNPRLLEWLDKILQNSPKSPSAERGVEMILQKMADKEKEFREDILAQVLLKQQTPALRQMLGKLLVYELPVPQAAISPIFEDISSWESHIQRAEILGLLEVTLTNNTERLYRVPRILSPLLEFPENPKGEELYKQAAQILYRLWWEEAETATEAQKLEIHRLALLGKDEDIAVNIASYLADNWKNQSRFREAVQLCKFTLELTQDYRVLHQIARSQAELGEVEQAQQYYQQALESCLETDETEKADIIHNLGRIYANKGEVEQAIALYNQSLEITERIGNVQTKAATLHQLGIIYANKGEVEQAIALYNQSLEITERIGNVKMKGVTLHQLGMIHANKGEVDEAIALFNQVLEIDERIGYVQGKAATLSWLGKIYANKGEVEQAIALFNQSLEITERIGNVKTKAAMLNNLGYIYADKGEVDQAIKLFNQSLEITERIENIQGKAAILNNLADIYANKGEVEKAIKLFNQSLEITQRIGDVQTKAVTLHQLGRIYANKGEVEKAIALFNQSLEITQRIGDVQTKAATLQQLGIIHADKGEVDQAIALYNQVLEIDERTGNVHTKAATLHNLAGIYANKGDVDEAIALFNQSLEIKERIGNVKGQAMTLWWLGGLAEQQGEYTKAISYLQPALEILQRLKSPDAESLSASLDRVMRNS